MNLHSKMITVQEAEDCCSTPVLDFAAFLGIKVLPAYLLAGSVVSVALIGHAVTDFIIKLAEKWVKHQVQARCFEAAVARRLHPDKRITVVSALQSPVDHRVRKRRREGLLLVPGGGEFGGGGAGSSWGPEDAVVEPITHLKFTGDTSEPHGLYQAEGGDRELARVTMGAQMSRQLYQRHYVYGAAAGTIDPFPRNDTAFFTENRVRFPPEQGARDELLGADFAFEPGLLNRKRIV